MCCFTRICASRSKSAFAHITKMYRISGKVNKRLSLFYFLCWGEVQVLDNKLNAQAILNGLGQGVLIFDSADKLVLDNLAARTLLGTDLKVIRDEGWAAISVLFNTRVTNPDDMIDEVRKRALTS